MRFGLLRPGQSPLCALSASAGARTRERARPARYRCVLLCSVAQATPWATPWATPALLQPASRLDADGRCSSMVAADAGGVRCWPCCPLFTVALLPARLAAPLSYPSSNRDAVTRDSVGFPSMFVRWRGAGAAFRRALGMTLVVDVIVARVYICCERRWLHRCLPPLRLALPPLPFPL